MKTQNNKIKIINNISKENIEISTNKLSFVKAQHNFQNLLAAYASSFLLNQKTDDFLSSIKNIHTLQHRIEFSGTFKNIDFYNEIVNQQT